MDEVFRYLDLADSLIHTGQELYDHIQQKTGKTVEEIRAERDALSRETHQIIDEELATLK